MGCATVDDLIGQARGAVALVPLPELILVQTIDHDIKCDGTDPQNYQPFGDALTEALDILASGAPNAKVFVVTQPGTVARNADATEGNPSWVSNWQGDGPCDAFDPSGQRADDKIAALQDVTDHYFAVQADRCAKFPNCSDDQGAWQRMMIEAADLTPDGNHPSIQGAAKRAAVTWTALYGWDSHHQGTGAPRVVAAGPESGDDAPSVCRCATSRSRTGLRVSNRGRSGRVVEPYPASCSQTRECAADGPPSG